MDDAKDVDHDGEVSSLPSRACVNREERIVDYKRSAGMLIKLGEKKLQMEGLSHLKRMAQTIALRRGIPSLYKSGKMAVVRQD